MVVNISSYQQNLIRKTKLNINRQHLFESDEIIAYICCYKYVKNYGRNIQKIRITL